MHREPKSVTYKYPLNGSIAAQYGFDPTLMLPFSLLVEPLITETLQDFRFMTYR